MKWRQKFVPTFFHSRESAPHPPARVRLPPHRVSHRPSPRHPLPFFPLLPNPKHVNLYPPPLSIARSPPLPALTCLPPLAASPTRAPTSARSPLAASPTRAPTSARPLSASPLPPMADENKGGGGRGSSTAHTSLPPSSARGRRNDDRGRSICPTSLLPASTTTSTSGAQIRWARLPPRRRPLPRAAQYPQLPSNPVPPHRHVTTSTSRNFLLASAFPFLP
jgi:hypothetical protein